MTKLKIQKVGRGIKFLNDLALRKIKEEFTNIKNLYGLFNAIMTKKSDKTNVVAFIVHGMQEAGGIETRVAHYCDFFSRQGFDVLIITKSNKNKRLKRYKNIYLDYYGSNFFICLHILVRFLRINFIELQSVPDAAMRFMDFDALRKRCTLGYVIHGTYIKVNYLNSDNFDYIIAASDLLKDIYGKRILMDIKVVPNAIPAGEKKYRYAQQKLALLITRIDEEKLPTIKSFIDFCKLHEISFEIAGSEAESDHVTHQLKEQYPLDNDVFIGNINTIRYLAQNVNKYLFIGGIGLVAIEAGMMGCPVFICSHLGVKHSGFMSIENVALLKQENFTIKKIHGPHQPGETQKQDFQNIIDGHVDKFIVHEYLKTNLSFEAVWDDYYKYINGKVKI